MAEKKYTISPPLGNYIVPKAIMTEQELRDYTLQIAANVDGFNDTWSEKIKNDKIDDVIDWLKTAGFIVNEK